MLQNTHQTLISNCKVNPSKLQKGVLNKFATKKKEVVQRNKKDQTVIQQPPKKVSWIAACDGISRAQYLLEVYLDSHPRTCKRVSNPDL